jgi:ribosomal-protein-alanine N-acetyltransferase
MEIVAVAAAHGAVLAALSERCLEDAWSEAVVGNILATPGAFGFIAVVRGIPEAFILCRAGGGECDVLALGTLPEARRDGLARRLVERAVEEAAIRGAWRMVLEVAEDNEAARGLYARCAFSLVGRRPRYYRRSADERADALVLSREWRPDVAIR